MTGMCDKTPAMRDHRGLTMPRRYKFGHLVRYRLSDVQAWINAQLVPTSQELIDQHSGNTK